MNNPAISEDNTVAASFSLGATLKQQRLNNQWAIEDVAAALNLSEYTVKALEADDYSDLPGSTFTKGYLRSYANLLGLDGDELTKSIQFEAESIGQIPTSRSLLRRKGKLQIRRRRKKKFGFVKFLFLLTIVIAAVAFITSKTASLDRNQLAEVLKMPFLKVEPTENQPANSVPENNSSFSLFGDTSTPANENNNETTNGSETEQPLQLRIE